MKKCYWCGEAATTGRGQHIPQNNLFRCVNTQNGKIKLLTVPSCEKHNNHLSNDDEEFKVWVTRQIGNNEEATKLNDTQVANIKLYKPEKYQQVSGVLETIVVTGIRNEMLDISEENGDMLLRNFESLFRGLWFLVNA